MQFIKKYKKIKAFAQRDHYEYMTSMAYTMKHMPHSIPSKETITFKLSPKELCRHDPSLYKQNTCSLCGTYVRKTQLGTAFYTAGFSLSFLTFTAVWSMLRKCCQISEKTCRGGALLISSPAETTKNKQEAFGHNTQ